jgi:hypothetical protein
MVNTRHIALGLAAAALWLAALPIGRALASDTVAFSPVAPAVASSSGWKGSGQYSLPPGIGAVTMSVSAAGGTTTDAAGRPVQALDISLTVANNGNQALALDPAGARLVDSGGRLLVGATAFSGSTVVSTITISPGGKDDLQLVFYLPASSQLQDMSTASVHWPYSYGNQTYAVDLEFAQGSQIYNAPAGPVVSNAPGDAVYGAQPQPAAEYNSPQPYDSLIDSALPYYGTTWGYGPGYWDWWFNPQPVWWGSNFCNFGGFGFPFFFVDRGRHEFHEFLEHRRGSGNFLSQHNALADGDPSFRDLRAQRSLFAPLAANRSGMIVGQSQRLDSIRGLDLSGLGPQVASRLNRTGRGIIPSAPGSFGTISNGGGTWTAGSPGNVPHTEFPRAPLTPIMPPRFNGGSAFTPRFQAGSGTFAASRQFSTSNNFAGSRVSGGSSFATPHFSSTPSVSHSFSGGSSFATPHFSSTPSVSHSFSGGSGGRAFAGGGPHGEGTGAGHGRDGGHR